jgi:hypothetical protein
MAGLLFGMAQGSDAADKNCIKSNFDLFQYTELVVENKCIVANELLKAGVLHNVLRNGEFIDYPTGQLVDYCKNKKIDLKAFVQTLLESGDTVTATPQMLKEEKLRRGVLNLENMRLPTVEDWKEQTWFEKVKTLNLATNQLSNLQVPFFELFPNLEKIILTSNPITHLDTTYMPYGLKIVAEHTDLKSISSTTLHKNGYIFNIAHTPLARDWQTLESYCVMCNQKQESIVSRIFNRCCGTYDGDSHDVGSRIKTVAISYPARIQQPFQ